jgi:hypothetical protein
MNAHTPIESDVAPNVPQSVAREHAEEYIRRGWHVLMVQKGGKAPLEKGWQKTPLNAGTASIYYGHERGNIGIALGQSGLADIDVDWKEGAPLADIIFSDLPSFGRASNPSSHRIMRCEGASHINFKLPSSIQDRPEIGGEHALMIGELRGGNGDQTVFPGSVHTSGEQVKFDAPLPDEIPEIAFDLAKRKMGLLASCTFFARFFPASGRCDYMMAVAGTLQRVPGIDADQVQRLVNRIGEINGDRGDKGDGQWRVAADKGMARLKNGEPVTGLPTVLKILGLEEDKSLGNTLSKWLGLSKDEEKAPNPDLQMPPSTDARAMLERPGKDVPRRDMLCEGTIERHKTSLMTGHGGGMKTQMAICIGLSGALGHRFGPFVPTRLSRMPTKELI